MTVRAALGTSRWKRAREATKARDGYRCVVCGSRRNLRAGHRIHHARYAGSHDDAGNLWTLCQSCNVAQGTMNADEWKLTESYRRRLRAREDSPRLSVGRPSLDVIRGDYS